MFVSFINMNLHSSWIYNFIWNELLLNLLGWIIIEISILIIFKMDVIPASPHGVSLWVWIGCLHIFPNCVFLCQHPHSCKPIWKFPYLRLFGWRKRDNFEVKTLDRVLEESVWKQKQRKKVVGDWYGLPLLQRVTKGVI